MDDVKKFRADYRHVVETEFDDAQYVGIGDFDAQRLRADTAEAELDALREAMADRDKKDEIRLSDRAELIDGFNKRLEKNSAKLKALVDRNTRLKYRINSAEQKLAAAEQCIADQNELIKKAHAWVDHNNFGGWDAYELRDQLAAALNPKPEAGSHEN